MSVTGATTITVSALARDSATMIEDEVEISITCGSEAWAEGKRARAAVIRALREAGFKIAT